VRCVGRLADLGAALAPLTGRPAARQSTLTAADGQIG